ncbi:hypothetical protein [Tichowtungia aerotolerans]|uniref:Uncharacterized protein n=1 Tax=Tichowtungia aerotolerans TaxID=2697043 RepID=A0A6P1M3F8_9BACT|nr:hypothetical protein [Tichowtungia aerotolerans]QHI69379.1 hypothetical protein GT409_07910 [Tichowtungia aerotolerans]
MEKNILAVVVFAATFATQAKLVKITYSGSFSGPLGPLQNAQFVWSGVFDTTPVQPADDNKHVDFCAVGDISFTLSGSDGFDGIYSFGGSISEGFTDIYDFFSLPGPSCLGEYWFHLGSICFKSGYSGGTNGQAPDPYTLLHHLTVNFNALQVSYVAGPSLYFFDPSGNMEKDKTYHYDVLNPTITVKPVPESARHTLTDLTGRKYLFVCCLS